MFLLNLACPVLCLKILVEVLVNGKLLRDHLSQVSMHNVYMWLTSVTVNSILPLSVQKTDKYRNARRAE